MVAFEFATATRIAFGAGRLAEAPAAVRALGSRPLVVTGRSGRHALPMEAVRFTVSGEPSVEDASEGVRLALAERCDVVVGLGGGSALDCAKAIAAIAKNGGDPLDFLEVIGRGRPIERP